MPALHLHLDFAFRLIIKKSRAPNFIFCKLTCLVFTEISVCLLAKWCERGCTVVKLIYPWEHCQTFVPCYRLIIQGVKEKTFWSYGDVLLADTLQLIAPPGLLQGRHCARWVNSPIKNPVSLRPTVCTYREKKPHVVDKCSESSSEDSSKACDIVWSN